MEDFKKELKNLSNEIFKGYGAKIELHCQCLDKKKNKDGKQRKTLKRSKRTIQRIL